MSDTLRTFNVVDRQTFIKFIDLMSKDYIENLESWENRTLLDFLNAMVAYAEDMQGYYDNMGLKVDAEKPNWSTFADIFRGAKIYE